MNLFTEKLRDFFRKKFNILRARISIAGIKGLIHSYQHKTKRINREIRRLKEKNSKYRGQVLIYKEMLEELREELKQ